MYLKILFILMNLIKNIAMIFLNLIFMESVIKSLANFSLKVVIKYKEISYIIE